MVLSPFQKYSKQIWWMIDFTIEKSDIAITKIFFPLLAPNLMNNLKYESGINFENAFQFARYYENLGNEKFLCEKISRFSVSLVAAQIWYLPSTSFTNGKTLKYWLFTKSIIAFFYKSGNISWIDLHVGFSQNSLRRQNEAINSRSTWIIVIAANKAFLSNLSLL